ncbi:hypothetical protein Tsubulata_034883 [Turnera subulata]|uniref:CRIB domain-containing protein n=1 Tax=Turnera subulata TaxID=218843 RepID=A0A9Q0F3Q8_9ROSI|nr:hypothetical protein Tsubulata_034883 [Turnera subulata]
MCYCSKGREGEGRILHIIAPNHGWSLFSLKMGTKVKGLMRGLRYISQIFATNVEIEHLYEEAGLSDEKEKEIEIGFPTDVKHVAHIGWDGPSNANTTGTNNNPSWMKEFSSSDSGGAMDGSALLDGSESVISKEETDTLSVKQPSEGGSHKGRKHKSRRSSGAGLPPDSPSRKSSDGRRHSKRQESADTSPRSSDAPKQSRRHRSSNRSMDSRDGDSVRSTRRSKNTGGAGSESPAQDDPQPPCIPKHSRARKSKAPKEQNNSQDVFPFTDNGSGGSECSRASKDIAV